MCGIAGIVAYDGGVVDAEALRRMTEAIRHRGPDDEGYHLGPGVGLGARRLAIVDVEGGNQPLYNEDRSIALVCNGELYNHAELRRELEARGHRFATRTDTEVLVHLYEESGERCMERVNGMFAFALWDEHERRLLAARDRLGKKPLYYADTGRELLLGSEPKALLRHPDCPRELDREALSRYLALEYVPSPHAIFAGMRKLRPAHRLVWRDGRLRIDAYWEFPAAAPDDGADDADLVEEFRERLREAVRLRLMSDVPLGAFLSGGIDSSSVVAFMAELAPERVRTFSIGFEEQSFDESEHARRVAAHFGTDHHERVFGARDLLDLLPDVAASMDEPFADASLLPTHLLSRFTRERVTVALGGDGGDELLAGYPTFAADRLARLYRVPRPLHDRVVRPLAERLPPSSENFSFEFKLKRFLRGMSAPPAGRHEVWLGSFPAGAQAELLREPPPLGLEAARGREDGVEGLIRRYATTYLPDDILVKVDRASMLASLEVRAPFLDYTLVEFLARVPVRLKLRGLRSKVILKRAMADRLPPGIARRPKKGFGIPSARWFRRELRELLVDELSRDRLERQGIFRPSYVDALVRDHLDGRRDLHKELWTLLTFQLWHRHYVETRPAPAAVSAAA